MKTHEQSESLLNIQPPGWKVYAFTVKYVKKDRIAYADDYYEVLETLYFKHQVFAEDIQFEMDSKKKLHVHGIATAPKNLKYNSIKIPGYHFHFKKVYINGFKEYMKKTRKTNEEVILDHYAQHNYMFTSEAKKIE